MSALFSFGQNSPYRCFPAPNSTESHARWTRCHRLASENGTCLYSTKYENEKKKKPSKNK